MARKIGTDVLEERILQAQEDVVKSKKKYNASTGSSLLYWASTYGMFYWGATARAMYAVISVAISISLLFFNALNHFKQHQLLLHSH